jgi:hypothetical protein
MFALLLCLVLAAMACSVSQTGDDEGDMDSAVETAIAETQAARPTDTPAPTDTPIPTEVPTLPPTDTLPPPPTKEPGPPPTEVPKIAYVKVINGLGVQLTVKLKGPEVRTFMIRGGAEMILEVKPGEYEYTLSAKNAIPATGTVVFPPGDFTWTITKE